MKKTMISPQKIEIARRIKKFRIAEFGLQQPMADFLGVKQALISKVENGTHYLTYPHRMKLVKEKRLNPKWLDFGIGSMYLNKDDLKKNLVTDINEIQMDVEYLRDQFELMKRENDYLLKLISELKNID